MLYSGCIVFTCVQNFFRNTEQLLFCFKILILREIACIRQNSLLFNILLIFSCLKSLISYICPYVSCPGCITVQQHTHCRNFIHFIFSSCLPVLRIFLYWIVLIIFCRLEIVILQRTSRCVCALKTNRCCSIKHNHDFINKRLVCVWSNY